MVKAACQCKRRGEAFRRCEVPLLAAYCQALSLSRWYALKVNETGDGEAFKRWGSATRTAVSLDWPPSCGWHHQRGSIRRPWSGSGSSLKAHGRGMRRLHHEPLGRLDANEFAAVLDTAING